MTAPLILGTNSIKDTTYDVDNSVRMDIGSSDHFERTPSSAVTAERKKFTVSCWLKRSVLGGEQAIISAGNGAGSEEFEIVFTNDNTLQVKHDDASSVVHQLVTNMVFRDTASWYNIVYVYDSANGTEALRARLFVNGVELTDANGDFSTYNPVESNELTPMNVDERHHIGSTSFDSGGSGASFFGGYMTEFFQTAGQANVASVFGEYDSSSPTIWKPKNPSGLSFGTNGFYLDFEDSSNLGKDVSGNTNNFTVDNLTSIDQCTDTCTNNFCTFTAENHTASNFTLTEGNLKVRRTTGTSGLHGSSIMPTDSGKWYFEVKIGEAGQTDRSRVGIMNYQTQLDNSDYTGVINTPSQGLLAGCTTSCKVGKHFVGDGGGASVTEFTASGDFADGNIVQFAMDLDNKAIYIGRDGTFLSTTGSSGGDPTSGSSKTGAITTSTTIMNGSPMTAYTGLSVGSGTDVSEMLFNFGNPPFAISSGNADDNGFGNFEHDVPAGYFALCSKNLAEHG